LARENDERKGLVGRGKWTFSEKLEENKGKEEREKKVRDISPHN